VAVVEMARVMVDREHEDVSVVDCAPPCQRAASFRLDADRARPT